MCIAGTQTYMYLYWCIYVYTHHWEGRVRLRTQYIYTCMYVDIDVVCTFLCTCVCILYARRARGNISDEELFEIIWTQAECAGRHEWFLWAFSISGHVRRDGTSQRHKSTCYALSNALNSTSSLSFIHIPLMLVDRTRGRKKNSSNVWLGNFESKLSHSWKDLVGRRSLRLRSRYSSARQQILFVCAWSLHDGMRHKSLHQERRPRMRSTHKGEPYVTNEIV